MAKIHFDVTTEVEVDITAEQLKKDHPEIIETLRELGYDELVDGPEEVFESELANLACECDDLYALIYAATEGKSNKYTHIINMYMEGDSHWVEQEIKKDGKTYIKIS